ncbi:MAG: RsmD family RNA methyltransferase [Prevotella sp.]|nr:RsmD family RNA methyltransferase [Prevotella sp.]
MRIITGKYKGRHFEIPRSFKARPTTDFAKENIFNVLTGYIDFEGATALDLFSGTGSISLELASRGCAQVISVEADRDHHRFIQQCIQKLSQTVGDGSFLFDNESAAMSQTKKNRPQLFERPQVVAIRGDVFRFVKSCKQQFDFIFADPPYALKELKTIPTLIFEKNLLKADGVFVFEHGKNDSFTDHPNFVEHRAYGSVNFSIFRPLHQG